MSSSALLSRRSFAALMMAGAAAGLAACKPAGQAGGEKAAGLVDLRGRPVKPKTVPARLSIDDGRYLIALALISPDPVSHLAAWAGDVNRIGPDMYAEFVAKFPAIEALPKTPSSAADFNGEAVLSAAPDVAVVSLGTGPSDAQAAQLEAAGLGVAYIDFFTHPLENQAKSLTLLGQLIGREEQAKAYNDFRAAKLAVIAEKVKGVAEDKRPTVFLEAHAGMTPDCCNSAGKGNIGDYITLVGGRNIGADQIAAASGKLSLEYILDRNPDIYIATGGPQTEKAGGFVVGPKYDAARASASLAKAASRKGINALGAVKAKAVHGLSHQLLNSPIDIVAVEVMAKWIHPDLFADLNPRATLDEINTRFLAVPYKGEYWAELPA